MTEALINTLLGMGTVFIALIVISGIIGLLKPLSDLVLGVNRNKSSDEVIATENAISDAYEEIDMDNETELVAVITAAIMASMVGTTNDGLVVRSIRRKK